MSNYTLPSQLPSKLSGRGLLNYIADHQGVSGGAKLNRSVPPKPDFPKDCQCSFYRVAVRVGNNRCNRAYSFASSPDNAIAQVACRFKPGSEVTKVTKLSRVQFLSTIPPSRRARSVLTLTEYAAAVGLGHLKTGE